MNLGPRPTVYQRMSLVPTRLRRTARRLFRAPLFAAVAPEGFKFLNSAPQILLPFQIDRSKVFIGNFSFQGLARLKPGVTIDQANADIARMIPLVAERFPLPTGFTKQMFDEIRLAPNVRPLSVDVVGDIGRTLWVLLGTVGLVLLIACANVANLFLVRAEGRQQELAIHAALGASRARIGWELLSESMALALAGGAAGLMFAEAGIRLLIAVAPQGLPRVEDIRIDASVLAFTIVISLCAGLLFGLLPVLKFANPHLASALKEGGRASSDGKLRHRARNALVVAEIALAVVLLVGSGLMMRTFQAMRRVDPGFTLPEQIAGVTTVGLSSSITMDGNDSNDPIFVEDFPGPGGGLPALRRFKWIGEHYFEAMGNRLIAGRPIAWNDVYTRPRSSSSPKTSRGSTGRSRQRHWAGAFGRIPGIRGGRSSASLPTRETTAPRSRLRPSCIGP